jgi:plastocyanin
LLEEGRRMRSRPGSILPLLVLLATPLSAAAAPSVVHGVLWRSRAEQHAGAGQATRAPTSDARFMNEAVVWVESVPEKTEERLAGRHQGFFGKRLAPRPVARMVQHRHAFAPRVLVVTAGDSVEFRNRDEVYHNVFSVSPANPFDLHPCAPGSRQIVTFPQAGVVVLNCELHPEERAYVVVVPNHAFTRPDGRGGFALAGLPRGSYELCAWHPRHGVIRQAFEVPAHGDALVSLAF